MYVNACICLCVRKLFQLNFLQLLFDFRDWNFTLAICKLIIKCYSCLFCWNQSSLFVRIPVIDMVLWYECQREFNLSSSSSSSKQQQKKKEFQLHYIHFYGDDIDDAIIAVCSVEYHLSDALAVWNEPVKIWVIITGQWVAIFIRKIF